MVTTMLPPATVTPKNRNLSTDPKRMAVSEVWGSLTRGAHKYGGEQGFVTIHNLPHVVSATGAYENTDPISCENVI